MTGEKTEGQRLSDQGHSRLEGDRAGTKSQVASFLLLVSFSLKEALVASGLSDRVGLPGGCSECPACALGIHRFPACGPDGFQASAPATLPEDCWPRSTLSPGLACRKSAGGLPRSTPRQTLARVRGTPAPLLWAGTTVRRILCYHPEFLGGTEPWPVRAETSWITRPHCSPFLASPSCTFIALLLIPFQINHWSHVLMQGLSRGTSLRQCSDGSNCHLPNTCYVPGVMYICPHVVLMPTLASGHCHLCVTLRLLRFSGGGGGGRGGLTKDW